MTNIDFRPSRVVEIAACTGRGAMLATGARIAVVDVEGQQIGDLFAFGAHDALEYMSPAHTRAALARINVSVGDQLVSNRRRPMLTVIEDTSPGNHDLLFPPCDLRRYRALGVRRWHPSCEENFRRGAAELGFEFEDAPHPLNVFQNTPVLPDGRIEVRPAASGPGERLVLRAEFDQVIVLAACSVDDLPANGSRCTGLRMEIDDRALEEQAR